MVTIVVCMSVYLIRVIAANAYLPPKASSRRSDSLFDSACDRFR